MRIHTKATNLDLTPAITTYIEDKLGSLQKFLDSVEGGSTEVLARVEIARTTKHHAKGPVYRVEVNIGLGQSLVRVEEQGYDIRAAIDVIRDVLQSKIVKFKEKLRPQDSKGEKLIRKNVRGK